MLALFRNKIIMIIKQYAQIWVLFCLPKNSALYISIIIHIFDSIDCNFCCINLNKCPEVQLNQTIHTYFQEIRQKWNRLICEHNLIWNSYWNVKGFENKINDKVIVIAFRNVVTRKKMNLILLLSLKWFGRLEGIFFQIPKNKLIYNSCT